MTSFLCFPDGNRLDHRLVFRRDGAVVVHRLSLFADLIHHIHSLGHIAEGGVLTVQEGAVLMKDEKLGALHSQISVISEF